jgi:hypothetical protein
MEPQHRDEAQESERRQTEKSTSSGKHAVVKPPFASEGLERVRDSHC